MYSALSLLLLIILIEPFCTFLYGTIFSFVVSPFSRENPAKRRFFLYSYSLNLSVPNTICNQLPTSPRTPATCESNTENPKPNQRHTEKKSAHISQTVASRGMPGILFLIIFRFAYVCMVFGVCRIGPTGTQCRFKHSYQCAVCQ